MLKIFNRDEKKSKNCIKIKKVNIISFKDKKLIFFLTNNELLLYEIKQDSFSLNLIKTFSYDCFFINEDIKFYYSFTYNNKIIFNFFSLRQIKLFLFDFEKNEFILKKTKNFCKDNSSKYFSYLKRSNKFLIFNCDEIVIYDSLFTKYNYLLSLEENIYPREFINSCKELKYNLLCVTLSGSISLFNSDTEKLLGNITITNPVSIKLIENNDNNFLLILSFGEINLYELKNFTFVQKLNTDKLKNIYKLKQLPNLNIAIIYGQYNLAIYDLKKNIINYQIKNETKTFYYLKYFYIKKIKNNILMYNPTRYSLHIINYIKGQVLAKFNDGLNKIQRCKRINAISLDENNINNGFNAKIQYFFIMNAKGYFLLKIDDI